MTKLKRLILFGSRIGLHFSGGSNASVLLAQHLARQFEEVYVIAKEVGPLNFPYPPKVMIWEDKAKIPSLLNSMSDVKSIFYGDFWDSIYLVKAKVPFFFTYHDNWPEQKFLDVRSWFLSFHREACYRKIFRNAVHVFSVTEHKRSYIGKFTNRHSCVPNGRFMEPGKFHYQSYKGKGPFRILMVGNLDARKYQLALQVFVKLSQDLQEHIEVDIYGHVLNQKLLTKLENFPFLHHKGYTSWIDYTGYHLFLSTSYMENLPISMLESILNFTPILSFDIGGISELVVNQQEGILVRPYDCQQLGIELQNIVQGKYSFSFPREKLSKFDWENSSALMMQQFRAHLNA